MTQQVAKHEPDNAARLAGSPRGLLAGQSITDISRNAHKKYGWAGACIVMFLRLNDPKNRACRQSTVEQKGRGLLLYRGFFTAVSQRSLIGGRLLTSSNFGREPCGRAGL